MVIKGSCSLPPVSARVKKNMIALSDVRASLDLERAAHRGRD
jgi:hypothetical protein